MIALMYPYHDWVAADTAVKIQAIAASKNLDIFITPKHGPRDEEALSLKLKKARYGLLLCFDSKNLDSFTKSELEILLNNNSKIFAIVPNDFKPLDKRIEAIPLDKSSPDKLEEQVKLVLNHIQKWEKIHDPKVKAKSEDTGLMILLMTGLLLLLLSASSKK